MSLAKQANTAAPSVCLLLTNDDVSNAAARVIAKADEFPRGAVEIPRIREQHKTPIRNTLKDVVEAVLGLRNGEPNIQVVVTASQFIDPVSGKPHWSHEPLFDELPSGSNSLLEMLTGAGISVLCLEASDGAMAQAFAWAAGSLNCRIVNAEALVGEIRALLIERKQDQASLEIQNTFAEHYDQNELSNTGTVSAILWENENLLSAVREYIKSAGNRKIRILDLGCGSGRFEEVLLTDNSIEPSIESITAIDFAPRHIVNARQRLAHFLRPKEFKKVTFLRRIVERLNWPANHFDFVIAGFGIVCYTKTHLTLPQIGRVLRPQGVALINGYNSAALTYEVQNLDGHPDTQLAISIDKATNKMNLGKAQIDCFTFHEDDVRSLIALSGLRAVSDPILTFPIVHAAVRRTLVDSAPGGTRNGSAAQQANAKRHERCVGRGTACKDFQSYQEVNLRQRHFGGELNQWLQSIDHDLAKVFSDRGFYFSIKAYKEKR